MYFSSRLFVYTYRSSELRRNHGSIRRSGGQYLQLDERRFLLTLPDESNVHRVCRKWKVCEGVEIRLEVSTPNVLNSEIFPTNVSSELKHELELFPLAYPRHFGRKQPHIDSTFEEQHPISSGVEQLAISVAHMHVRYQRSQSL